MPPAMLLALLTVVLLSPAAAAVSCPKECGGVEIPYPFGIGHGCYLETGVGGGNEPFNVTCSNRDADGKLQAAKPIPMVDGGLQVLHIDVDGGWMRAYSRVSSQCYNGTSPSKVDDNTWWYDSATFRISGTDNVLTVVGCDVLAYIGTQERGVVNRYMAGCNASCRRGGGVPPVRPSSMAAAAAAGGISSCDGTDGCCWTPIQQGIRSFFPSFVENTPDGSGSGAGAGGSPCRYAFLVEKGQFKYRTSYAINRELDGAAGKRLPLVLDWAVGNKSCVEAQKDKATYACRGENHRCEDSKNGTGGYLCKCKNGYKGNAYRENGCKFLDTCKETNPCHASAKCVSVEGRPTCLCPRGRRPKGDGSTVRCEIDYTMPAIEMSRNWMYDVDRRSQEFIDGVHYFLSVAEANKRDGGFMCCPCTVCRNSKEYASSRNIHSHLFKSGFMPNYTCWTKHGESGVIMEEGEEEELNDEDIIAQYAGAFNDTAMDDADEEVHVAEAEDEEVHVAEAEAEDNLGQVIRDAQSECEEKEKKKFERMLEDHKKLLYPTCDAGQKKLGTTLELLQWKAKNGVSDKAFGELLTIQKKMLPKDNELPSTTYEAKQLVCPLGLEFKKIHACPNDCFLYYGEDNEKLDACPTCNASRYKIRRDDPGDVEGEKPRKRIPAKVVWYAPIIPRLKRLFRNKDHAKLMRWHKEDRKVDNMLRHPADGTQWRAIDREFPDFADDARNLRFALSTDGLNPFGEQSSSHSTWPVTLSIYNLPPWLCMKRKFIMMPVLIPGPKQPGNDIDVYLRPLVDELLLLWKKPGVRVWDEYKQEHFDLRALLFVTINDWPALSNISGQSNKGYNACTHCFEDCRGIYLKNCRKIVYLGYRQFLPAHHPLRKKGKHFNGRADHRPKPANRTGEDVLEMVNDVHVVFGKGPGSEPVANDAEGHAPMWKKSIFWELPYWKVLEVRSAIDVMHLTKNVCVNLLGFMGVYGTTKDTSEAREDMQNLTDDGREHLGPASYALTKEEKDSMFECLNSIKVPSGFSSNIKGIINVPAKKFQNLKSHDCHVLMTQLLPVALRGILPQKVRLATVKLCAFLNAISQKAINPQELAKLQNDVVQCLVSFELVFPPSFFNVMTHLLVHLVKEIAILGPVFLHNMFPFERFMGVLKKYVRNRARPEGSIAKGYGTEEVIEFCVDYIPDLDSIGVPDSRHEGRLRGKGILGKKKYIAMQDDDFNKAHYTVLQNSSLVHPYIEAHKQFLQSEFPEKNESWIRRQHMDTFGIWLRKKCQGDQSLPGQLYRLAMQPSWHILTYKGYDINGNTYYTVAQDKKSTNQNSGVRIDATAPRGEKETYYGQVEEIWELDYGANLKIPLFRCQWLKMTGGMYTLDKEYGMTIVDLNNTGYKEEPFVLAKDVSQVFYVKDMSSKPKRGKTNKEPMSDEPRRHIVLSGKANIVGIEDKSDMSEDYEKEDRLVPFIVNKDPSIMLNDEETPWSR